MLNLQSIYFGQKHPNFDYKDFDIVKRISRLARKHLRQAVNYCNGEGFVNGEHYYNGKIDEWARRTYGQNVKSAYIDNNEETIFYKEMEKIENKIIDLVGKRDKEINNLEKKGPFTVDFQGDPRGNTVKLYYEGDFIEL